MYDAKADFEHHEGETHAGLEALRNCGFQSSANARVLDLGGGQGMHAGFLSQVFEEVYCSDILEYTTLYGGDFCKRIVEKHHTHRIPIKPSGVRFIQTDAMSLLYRDNFFDCCFCVNAFEHIPDPQMALKEILRTLKPGGYAYISFDPIWTADTGSHFSGRVPEPWAHLVLSETQFVKRMLDSGANLDEAEEFKKAMNRWRLSRFEAIFDYASESVVFHDEYSGFVQSDNPLHENFQKAQNLGYSERELGVRRLRWVLKKQM